MKAHVRVLISVFALVVAGAVTAPAVWALPVGVAALSTATMVAPAMAGAAPAAVMVVEPTARRASPVAVPAMIPVSGLPTWPVLSQGGNTGWPAATVRSLQYLLNAHGACLMVDGIFGPRTDSAVRSYQRAHGLAVDGIVGPRTWSSVIITVQRGSAGSAVKAVQDEANSRGPNSQGPPLVVDGIFGPQTDAWVRAFQNAIAGHVIGFVEDGVVGPLTWSLLVTGEKPDPLYQSP